MIIETLSTFPDMYASVMGSSMMRIAQEKGILEFKAHDLRDWTHDRHRTTDDDPYGGGDGLVMKCEPIFEAYDDIAGVGPRPTTVVLSPCGDPVTDAEACELSREERQYTRPATFRGMGVPPVLLSGNHAAVADWRRKQSLERTARLRPDLLEDVDLSAADRAYLKDLGL